MENKKTLKEQIIDHTVKFSIGTALRGAGQFINQYFSAFLLGPVVFGIWQGSRLILSYGGCAGLGSAEGMSREIPILRGKREEEKTVDVKNVSFLFNFFTTLCVSTVIFIVSFFIKLNPTTVLSLRFVALILIIQFFKSFLEGWLKANNKFDIISKMAVIEGIGAAASVILIFFFSFAGFLAGCALNLFLSALYGYLKSGFTFEVKWDSKLIKLLIKIGFPIMLLGLSDALFYTVDRLLILKFLNVESLGFYSLGTLVFTPAMFIFYASSSVMYPRFAERFGATGRDSELKKFIILPIRILSLVTTFIIGAIVVVLPVMIRLFLPAYIEGIMPAQIIIFGLFFSYSIGMVANFFLATKRQYIYLAALLTGVFINSILSFIFLKMGWGIVGVALGASFSYFVFFLLLMSLIIHYCKMTSRESFIFFMEVLSPLLYVFIVSFFILKILNTSDYSILGLILNSFLREITYLVFASGLIYFLFKNLEIKNYLMSLFGLPKNEKI